MNTILRTLGFSLLIALLGCSQNQPNTETPRSPEIRELLSDWNEAHNTKDVHAIYALYDLHVLYYKQPFFNDACVQDKFLFFEKYPNFKQIIENVHHVLSNDTVTIHFNKLVTMDAKSQTYPSYLKFVQKDKEWKIIEESDSITDLAVKNLYASNPSVPADAVRGHFNDDDIWDYMWLEKPSFPERTPQTQEGELMGQCIGECDSYIAFSDKTIPKIFIKSCIDGIPQNLGDMNGNGIDDIALIPGWWTSCHMRYYTWTNINGSFAPLVDCFSVHCNQLDDDVAEIKIDPKKEGYVTIQFKDWGPDMWKIATKSVKMAK